MIAPMYTTVALPCHGYWSSHGRPSDKRNVLDAAATIGFHKTQNTMLWAPNLRAGVALFGQITQIENEASQKSNSGVIEIEHVKALGQGPLLEAPFPHPSAFCLLPFTRRSGCRTVIVTLSRGITETADELDFA